MKHIFLTGEIQIGKSTVLRKALSLVDARVGGFRTYFGSDRADPFHSLYIGRAGGTLSFAEENVIARFSPTEMPRVFPERFDTLGPLYIREAADNAALILMDECGSLEAQAYQFQAAVLAALSGAKPVLGVVKLASVGWVDQIRFHPNVELISVNIGNRDALPQIVAEKLRRSLSE